MGEDAMNAQQLLQEISNYCRQAGLAESTFGRRAVNDGKLANRLRNGGRITTDTLDRIRVFMSENGADMTVRAALIPRTHEARPPAEFSPPLPTMATAAPRITLPTRTGETDPQRNFRFFDSRQKYL